MSTTGLPKGEKAMLQAVKKYYAEADQNQFCRLKKSPN